MLQQVDMLDDHSLLRASVKKAAAVKKELRVQLLETQRRRQRTRLEMAKVRGGFEREERTRRRLEETHKFLADLESLRDEVVGSDDENKKEEDQGEQTDGSQMDNTKVTKRTHHHVFFCIGLGMVQLGILLSLIKFSCFLFSAFLVCRLAYRVILRQWERDVAEPGCEMTAPIPDQECWEPL